MTTSSKPNAVIWSHNNGAAAKALAERLGIKLLAKRSSKALPSSIQHIINLGCDMNTAGYNRITSVVPIINSTDAVLVAKSKIQTLSRLAMNRETQRYVPDFALEKERAEYMIMVQGKTLVARTVDNGHGGIGIVPIDSDAIRAGGSVPTAPLYVQAIDKRREYRVHLGRMPTGSFRVIDITRKIRRPGVDDTSRPFVWNHDNDFIFVRNNVMQDGALIERIRNVCISALSVLGLQFGAFDVVIEKGSRLNDSKIYILEVNTSPGMEGITLERYAQFFEVWMGTRRIADYPSVLNSGSAVYNTYREGDPSEPRGSSDQSEV